MKANILLYLPGSEPHTYPLPVDAKGNLTLEGLQKAIGGFIETLTFSGKSETYYLIMDEEGKYKSTAKPNFLTEFDVIVGPVLIAKKKNTEIIGLSRENITEVKDLLDKLMERA